LAALVGLLDWVMEEPLGHTLQQQVELMAMLAEIMAAAAVAL
jgi:hypothetical protein